MIATQGQSSLGAFPRIRIDPDMLAKQYTPPIGL